LPTSRKTPKVLLVDDHVDFRETMTDLLVDSGYAVTEAGALSSGLAQLEAGTFDLLLTDFKLPDGTGVQLLQRAKAAGVLSCRSVVITANAEKAKADLGAAGDIEVAFVVEKPFDLATFKTMLSSLLRTSKAR
jgi:CheY-like chemotaxis protein